MLTLVAGVERWDLSQPFGLSTPCSDDDRINTMRALSINLERFTRGWYECADLGWYPKKKVPFPKPKCFQLCRKGPVLTISICEETTHKPKPFSASAPEPSLTFIKFTPLPPRSEPFVQVSPEDSILYFLFHKIGTQARWLEKRGVLYTRETVRIRVSRIEKELIAEIESVRLGWTNPREHKTNLGLAAANKYQYLKNRTWCWRLTKFPVLTRPMTHLSSEKLTLSLRSTRNLPQAAEVLIPSSLDHFNYTYSKYLKCCGAINY